jgi:pimeloyl-ACP methyl ester carboxylesterase
VSSLLGELSPALATRLAHSANGETLPYFVAGSAGPHVVCINAIEQDLLIFGQLIAVLSARHRVVAWRLRSGSGGSGPVATVRDHVSDFRQILNAERIGDCSLVAWCSGAKIALESARAFPEVSSVVVTNGTFKTIPGLERAETDFEQSLFELCSAVVKEHDLAPLVMDSIRTLLGGGVTRFAQRQATTTDLRLAALIVEPFQSPQTTLRYAEQVVSYMSSDISATLRVVRQPVLIVAGQHDQVSSPAMAAEVAGRLARGSFLEVPGGSHYCLYKQSAETIAAVAAFISSPGRA